MTSRGAFTLHVDVEVRDLTLADLDDLAWSGSESHLHAVRLELARAQLGEVVYLCATLRDRPVGKLGVDLAHHPDTALLWQFAVHPELQGLGIGTGLVHAAEDVARAAGKLEADIGVGVSNADAQRLYERLGYVVVGEEIDEWTRTWPDGRTELVRDRNRHLRKRLV